MSALDSGSGPEARTQVPTLADLFLQFLIIGTLSFGGGIIAYEQILLVEKRKWLSHDEFMANLAISQTMPGLNSVNMAVLAGDQLRGVAGAICAAVGLILPGAAFVLLLGVLYAGGHDHPVANLLLVGVAAAATGLLTAVTYKIGYEHFRHLKPLAIIIATFVCMAILKLSLIVVLLIMVPVSIYLYRPRQDQ